LDGFDEVNIKETVHVLCGLKNDRNNYTRGIGVSVFEARQYSESDW